MAFDYKQYFGDVLVAQNLLTRPEERTWRTAAPARDAEHHDIVLYLGCNVLRTSHMIQTVTAIFDRLGLDYIAVGGPTYCCGIVHHQNGDTAASTGMNRRTLEHFQRYTPREVVMWCPSCIYFYDEAKQRKLPFPTRQTAEFLAAKLPEIRFTHERTRQQDSPLPTAGQRAHAGIGGNLEPGKHLRNLLIRLPALGLGPGEPVGDHVRNPAVVGNKGVLRQPANAKPGLAPHGAFLRRQVATDDLKQRGLTCAVAADDADTLARFDAEIGLI